MKTSQKVILACIILLIILSSLFIVFYFNSQNLSIRKKILKAHSSIDSYYIDETLTIYVKRYTRDTNPKKSDLIEPTAVVKLYKKGTIDKKNERAHIIVTSEIPTLIFLSYEIYKVDDYLYWKSNLGDTWKKMHLGEDTCKSKDLIESLYVFDDISKFIENAKFTKLRDEKIDDSSYYVFEIDRKLDQKVLESLINKISEGDFSGISIKNFSYVIWVNKNTFFVEKLVTNLEFSQKESLEGKQGTLLEMGVKTETRLKDINNYPKIELQQDVLKATDDTSKAKELIALENKKGKKFTCLDYVFNDPLLQSNKN